MVVDRKQSKAVWNKGGCNLQSLTLLTYFCQPDPISSGLQHQENSTANEGPHSQNIPLEAILQTQTVAAGKKQAGPQIHWQPFLHNFQGRILGMTAPWLLASAPPNVYSSHCSHFSPFSLFPPGLSPWLSSHLPHLIPPSLSSDFSIHSHCKLFSRMHQYPSDTFPLLVALSHFQRIPTPTSFLYFSFIVPSFFAWVLSVTIPLRSFSLTHLFACTCPCLSEVCELQAKHTGLFANKLLCSKYSTNVC